MSADYSDEFIDALRASARLGAGRIGAPVSCAELFPPDNAVDGILLDGTVWMPPSGYGRYGQKRTSWN